MIRCLITLLASFGLLSASGQSPAELKKGLQGKWISEDDPKYKLVFTGNLKQDFYEGVKTSSSRYWIRHDSLISLITLEKNIDTLYYAIDGLSATHLTLMYLGRGNFLMFRRPAAAKSKVKRKK